MVTLGLASRRQTLGVMGWALPWDSLTLPKKRGVQITDLGSAAFELGRLERGDELPEPVGAPVVRTGGRA